MLGDLFAVYPFGACPGSLRIQHARLDVVLDSRPRELHPPDPRPPRQGCRQSVGVAPVQPQECIGLVWLREDPACSLDGFDGAGRRGSRSYRYPRWLWHPASVYAPWRT